jgi:hypothetical protein
MKSLFYIIAAFLLCFVSTTKAQINIIPIDLIVEDDLQGAQQIKLGSNEEVNVHAEHDIYFTISLKHQSSLENVRYFRLAYLKYAQTNAATSEQQVIDDPQHGITTPVLIPPVRKKKVQRSQNLFVYPYHFNSNMVPRGQRYEVTMFLVEYATFEDYIDNKNVISVLGEHSFYINVLPDTALSNENSTEPFSISSYPNPMAQQFTVALRGKTTDPTSPLTVTLFNEQGMQVREFNLTNFTRVGNDVLYRVPVATLSKGMYYCKMQQQNKVTMKTILKQ